MKEIKVAACGSFEDAGQHLLHFEGQTCEKVLDDQRRRSDASNASQTDFLFVIHVIVTGDVVARANQSAESLGETHPEAATKLIYPGFSAHAKLSEDDVVEVHVPVESIRTQAQLKHFANGELASTVSHVLDTAAKGFDVVIDGRVEDRYLVGIESPSLLEEEMRLRRRGSGKRRVITIS